MRTLKPRQRTYSGSKNPAVTDREIKHRAIARTIAADGMVLLKNDGILPIAFEQKLVIYGNGTAHFIKGGTGSGDVNERETVSIQEGLKSAGYTLLNEEAAISSVTKYQEAQLAWRDQIYEKIKDMGVGSDMAVFREMRTNPFLPPEFNPIVEAEAKAADAVIYMISRISGEGSDRFEKAGDYYLSDSEKKDLKLLAKLNENIVVLINTGGQIDLKEVLQNTSVKAILYISQGGMETGNAVADLLSGKVCPSGKLTSTWAVNYSDYPNSDTFSHNNGNTDREFYEEGIYVGYRYFDSFGVKAQYPFGFGLSYTTFESTAVGISADCNTISVEIKVTNTGSTAGKEIVQVYASCSQIPGGRELKKLVGFAKTNLLKSGESQQLTVSFTGKDLAYYCEKDASWQINAGDYMILVGASSVELSVAGVLQVAQDTIIEKLTNVCPVRRELKEILPPEELRQRQREIWEQEAKAKGTPILAYQPLPIENKKLPESELMPWAREIAHKLSEDELIALLMGEITKGQDNLHDNELVETGIYVPGAAGETTCILEEKYGVPPISMADGPAGLRLMRFYDVDRESGKIWSESLLSALSGGLFSQNHGHENSDRYYMYATAIPIGTLLAQSWDPTLLQEVGQLVAEEMLEFGISWWLAPGMNIQRNPFCGRNFEYYSEDPLVAGRMAAAITKGVQSVPGVGTTIKHFACNNQEDNRNFSDSIVSERTLREIYLRGFEIAVKESQPMCMMSSYNKLNGVPTCNNYDLLTTVARGEWDYKGIIMSDWTTTTGGCGTAHLCAVAGNDLIMPGDARDIAELKGAFADGSLTRAQAEECAARLICIIGQTTGMENPVPYQVFK